MRWNHQPEWYLYICKPDVWVKHFRIPKGLDHDIVGEWWHDDRFGLGKGIGQFQKRNLKKVHPFWWHWDQDSLRYFSPKWILFPFCSPLFSPFWILFPPFSNTSMFSPSPFATRDGDMEPPYWVWNLIPVLIESGGFFLSLQSRSRRLAFQSCWYIELFHILFIRFEYMFFTVLRACQLNSQVLVSYSKLFRGG